MPSLSTVHLDEMGDFALPAHRAKAFLQASRSSRTCGTALLARLGVICAAIQKRHPSPWQHAREHHAPDKDEKGCRRIGHPSRRSFAKTPSDFISKTASGARWRGGRRHDASVVLSSADCLSPLQRSVRGPRLLDTAERSTLERLARFGSADRQVQLLPMPSSPRLLQHVISTNLPLETPAMFSSEPVWAPFRPLT